MMRLFLLVLAFAGCKSSSPSAPQPDLSSVVDMSRPLDLSRPRDLSQPSNADLAGSCSPPCGVLQVCFMGNCVDYPKSCTDTVGPSACGSGTYCVDGKCSPVCGQEKQTCIQDTDCCSFHCVGPYNANGVKDGACSAVTCRGLGAQCASKYDCCMNNYGYDCVNGQCSDCDANHSCTSSIMDCCGHVCGADGYCTQIKCGTSGASCMTSTDCCDLLTCVNHVCGTGCKATFSTCQYDYECCSGSACYAGKCLKYNGTTCAADSECESGRCLVGPTRSTTTCSYCHGTGDLCNSQSDCCSGFVCTGAGTCAAECNAGNCSGTVGGCILGCQDQFTCCNSCTGC